MFKVLKNSLLNTLKPVAMPVVDLQSLVHFLLSVLLISSATAFAGFRRQRGLLHGGGGWGGTRGARKVRGGRIVRGTRGRVRSVRSA